MTDAIPAPWPHQVRAVERVREAVRAGYKRILLTAPTGAGKTRIARDLILSWLAEGLRIGWYSNRKLLVRQTSDVLAGFGIEHGVRAAEFEDHLGRDVQVSMIQTEHSRVLRNKSWPLHDADRVLVDEAHLQKSDVAKALLGEHLAEGAVYVGLTATPLDLKELYDVLLTCATMRELRECGALVAAKHYGPDEPDCRHIRKQASGEYGEGDVRKVIMTQTIWARVLDWYKRLNPDQRPSLLFAPDVAGSIYFAEQFSAAGIRAAHIDGQECWLDGQLHRSGESIRSDILSGSRDGSIKVVCNRFVLREGLDLKWMEHGILATVFGSVQSYLQSCGRLLRACPETGKTGATIQDHGGCLDEETEILTRRGWVGRTGIRDDDEVAAFDRNTGEILWQSILHRHDRTLDDGEEMYEVVGRCCDIRVTGNHKFLFKKRTCRPDVAPVWPAAFSLGRADSLAVSNVRFKIPVSGCQRACGIPLTDDELRFVGWFLTDGTMERGRTVSVTQANHQPQLADLRACVSGCGFDFREYPRRPKYFKGSKPQTKIVIPKGTCKARPRRGWVRLQPYLDKDFSPLLEEVTERQFEVLLHAIHLGDGAKDRRPGSYRISTGNRVFADRLQAMCVRRGFKCNISVQVEPSEHSQGTLMLNIKKQSQLTLHGFRAVGGQARVKKTQRAAGERVWCVANALETLVTRRCGCVAIIGNSWHRHGSVNAEREWNLSDTGAALAEAREQSFREKRGDPEPVRCPKCAAIRVPKGNRCPACGYQSDPKAKSRPVVQLDGEIRLHYGDVYKPRKVSQYTDTEKKWLSCYYRCQKSGKNFNQALGLFVKENGYWPPKTLKNMPLNELDWSKTVKNVPWTELRRESLEQVNEPDMYGEPA